MSCDPSPVHVMNRNWLIDFFLWEALIEGPKDTPFVSVCRSVYPILSSLVVVRVAC